MTNTIRPDIDAPASTDADDGKRSSAGSNYGDFVPAHRKGTGRADPSKGAELERDALAPTADFSVAPASQPPSTTTNERNKPD